MSRVAVLFVLCVLLAAVVTAQNTASTAVQQQQQTPGILERVLTEYVYPLRDYDWRNALRNIIGSVMNYLAPATKEPKAGGGAFTAQERARVLVRRALVQAVQYAESFMA
ncbi:hypothetical protein Pcinc_002203 [Petrolisthes cinctipes]|uniref:Uncharacterized protein n=1 Tax=Petrolisthes cinctipes TaxID=88211 RepID=A0AAE1GLF0_PETCI|nr:hypothetical protein Pcinc_002203 [Petrolisthes cinctipes]